MQDSDSPKQADIDDLLDYLNEELKYAKSKLLTAKAKKRELIKKLKKVRLEHSVLEKELEKVRFDEKHHCRRGKLTVIPNNSH